MNKVDFHCHSTASDGELSPFQLAERAKLAELDCWAITDHDTVEGYKSLKQAGTSQGLISGIELSTQFGAIGLHIVGLAFDDENACLQEKLAEQQQSRIERARAIAVKLEKVGLTGVVDFVESLGQRPVSRPEIASFLVESGQVKDIKKAFDRYLGKGKAGDVKHPWPTMHEAIRWINEAGGVCVLAHPESYSLTRTKLRAVVKEFHHAGGAGIELPHEPATGTFYKTVASFCQEFDLKASLGSDFHSDKQSWRSLGKVPNISTQLTPIWTLF